MKCPYEQLGGKSQKVCFVPIDVINPDGSKTPATIKVPVAALEKIKDLAEGKGKKKGMKDKLPNMQSVPLRNADARRIKAAFNPVPDSEEKRKQFFNEDDKPTGERLSDMPLDPSLYSSKGKKQNGPRKDYDGMVLRNYQQPPRQTDSNHEMTGRFTPFDKDEIKAFLDRIRDAHPNDEMFMAGDFADGSGIKRVNAPKVMHVGTPTGRTPPNYESLLSEQVRENWRRIQMDFDVDEPNENGHRQFLPFFAEAAFRAGRDIGKQNLSHTLFRHQLEALRDVLAYGEGGIGMACFEDNGKMAFDFETNLFRPMVINPRTAGRKSRGIGGHMILDPNWLRMDYRNNPDYRRLKALYSGEEFRSKIKDEKKRHEAICTKLLHSYKKRRKAIRKVLDQVLVDLKKERETTSDTPQA